MDGYTLRAPPPGPCLAVPPPPTSNTHTHTHTHSFPHLLQHPHAVHGVLGVQAAAHVAEQHQLGREALVGVGAGAPGADQPEGLVGGQAPTVRGFAGGGGQVGGEAVYTVGLLLFCGWGCGPCHSHAF